MKQSHISICITSLLLVVATFSSMIPGMFPITALLFGISPVLIIWMVISILREKPASEKKFSEGWFYEDSAIRGIPDSEDPGVWR